MQRCAAGWTSWGTKAKKKRDPLQSNRIVVHGGAYSFGEMGLSKSTSVDMGEKAFFLGLLLTAYYFFLPFSSFPKLAQYMHILMFVSSWIVNVPALGKTRSNLHAENGNLTFAFCTVPCLDAFVDFLIVACGLMRRSERVLCASLLIVPDLRNILNSASLIVIFQRISGSCPALQGTTAHILFLLCFSFWVF